ncbi:LysR substrate binding domain protein [compost metagenome]
MAFQSWWVRVTNSDALVAPLLAGIAIAKLPEFTAAEYLADGPLKRILPEWSMTPGGLYFVTPSARAWPLKVQVLADLFAENLSSSAWQQPAPG